MIGTNIIHSYCFKDQKSKKEGKDKNHKINHDMIYRGKYPKLCMLSLRFAFEEESEINRATFLFISAFKIDWF